MATTKATTLAHTLASTTSSTADLDYAKTLNDTGVTSTEFDKLDGLTATTTELNKLSGATATTDELNLVDGSVSGPLSHRNMVINGAMQIHQRGGTISYAHDGTKSAYSLDRFRFNIEQTDQYDATIEQHFMSSADYNTTGFSRALKLTTGTAESAIGANEHAYITQIIEAQNLQHLQYGTASAKSVTLSFWAKASVTGTYAVGLYKADTTQRVINKTYTVSDTGWNQYTLTFPGDTDSGATIASDNGPGLYVTWHLAAGSDYNDGANTSWENYGNTGWAGGHAQNGIITTASATFYLTGVQLELGTIATPFEHRSYADELLRCQRYFQKIENTASGTEYFGLMQAYSASGAYGIVRDYVTTMRAEPHTVTSGGTFGAYKAGSQNAGTTTGMSGLNATPISWLSSGFGSFSGLNAGDAVVIFWNANAYLTASAEL